MAVTISIPVMIFDFPAAVWLHAMCALAYGLLCALILARQFNASPRGSLGRSRTGIWLAVACGVTAIWAASVAILWDSTLMGIAAWLEFPNVAYVKKVDEIKEGYIRVSRMMEDGTDTLEMPLPAVIAVVKEINEPRVASLKGKMAAKKAIIPKWTAADIEADKTKVGLSGSPTIVASSFNPPPRTGGVRVEGKTPEEKAKNLVNKLVELKLL